MNIVPNDILGVTKLLRMIISHTTHWSHKIKQGLYWNNEKHMKYYNCFIVMFHLFHGGVA